MPNDLDSRPMYPTLSVLTSIAALALAGCAPPLGRFASSGGLLGVWNTTANFCASGVTAGADGTTTVVWFSGGFFSHVELSTGVVAGKLVLVSVQSASPYRKVDLSPEQCTRFEVQQRPEADGTLGADIELDCDGGNGGRITASIHAASCR
jgi:hypothetical protein